MEGEKGEREGVGDGKGKWRERSAGGRDGIEGKWKGKGNWRERKEGERREGGGGGLSGENEEDDEELKAAFSPDRRLNEEEDINALVSICQSFLI